MNIHPRSQVALLLGALVSTGLLACKKDDASSNTVAPGTVAAPTAAAEAPESIRIDGSSTVFPISEAVAEEFQKTNTGSRVTVAKSGTGGGFKKFCAGELALAGASRPITATEQQACTTGNVEFVELPVAYDGLVVVVNPKNSFVQDMTVAELAKLWAPEAQGKVTKWSQIRAGWPEKEIRLFGPGVDSGTYDYFTKAIVGKEHSSRGDYTSSEDDNVLVQGVAGDDFALGYFGYAYYASNKARLKLVAIDDGKDDNGKGPIAPSAETVANATYQPLSRPIFLYASKTALGRPEVAAFTTYYVDNAAKLAPEAGYMALSGQAYDLVKSRLTQRTLGSAFGAHGSMIGVSLEQILSGTLPTATK